MICSDVLALLQKEVGQFLTTFPNQGSTVLNKKTQVIHPVALFVGINGLPICPQQTSPSSKFPHLEEKRFMLTWTADLRNF